MRRRRRMRRKRRRSNVFFWVISPQARDAAKWREVSGRVERELREERTAQWMATLRGPGWARRGRCHMAL